MTRDPLSSPTADQLASAIPRDILVFLVQLSVALNKTRAYPLGHPVLSAAVDILVQRLVSVLDTRPVFSLGIGATQLLVEEAATDSGHAVLRDLAEKIHRHQLAGIRFHRGVTVEEVLGLLRMLADESWRQGRPAGLVALEWAESPWPGIQLEPLPLEHLALAEETRRASERKAEELWRGLATAVLGVEQDSSDKTTSAEELAERIRTRADDPDFAKTMVDWLSKADQLIADAGPDASVARNLEDVIGALGPETLARMLSKSGGVRQRQLLALAGSRSLPVGAVLEVLRAAEDPDHSLSHSMVRILTKLAGHANVFAPPILPGADGALRDSVRHLLGEWSGSEDTDAAYRRLLELLSRPVKPEPAETHAGPGKVGGAKAEALRLVQMGLEIGTASPSVERAIDDLLVQAEPAAVADLYLRSRGDGPAAHLLHLRVVEESWLGPVLMDESASEESLGMLVEAAGADATAGLLNALEGSESTSRRRWLLSYLERLGPELSPALVERLPGKPWYVQRNLLGLLGSVGLPAGFSPVQYTSHGDPRVRREAYKLLLAQPADRTGALLRAAADRDDGIASLALAAALEDCPQELSDTLPSLLRSRYQGPELRAQAIRLLGLRPSTGGRDWLLAQVVERGWFGRRRLARKSPDVLASLRVLAAHWAGHSETGKVLAMARASRDQEIREAVRTGGGGAA